MGRGRGGGRWQRERRRRGVEARLAATWAGRCVGEARLPRRPLAVASSPHGSAATARAAAAAGGAGGLAGGGQEHENRRPSRPRLGEPPRLPAGGTRSAPVEQSAVGAGAGVAASGGRRRHGHLGEVVWRGGRPRGCGPRAPIGRSDPSQWAVALARSPPPHRFCPYFFFFGAVVKG